MVGRWLDISDAYGTRREVLGVGLTRLGGGDSEIRLAGTGSDQLHVWDDPPRVIFVGGGTPPTCAGVSFEERQLRPGDRIEWVGVSLEFGGEAAHADQATVEEVALDAPHGHRGMDLPRATGAPIAPGAPIALGAFSDTDRRLALRLRAGLLVDLGKADRKVLKRWQQAVMEDRFEADACASELEASAEKADELALLERTARLLRDFIMTPLMRGVSGASRRAKRAARGGVAFVIAQVIALVVYSLIVIAAMLLLRIKDVSFDQLLDRVLMRN